MTEHDPSKFIRAISSKLATRSRHVCVLLGAGTSRAAGLPDVKGLTKIVLDKLVGDQKVRFEEQLKARNLEEALSRVRRIQALLSPGPTLEKPVRTDAYKTPEAVLNLALTERYRVPVEDRLIPTSVMKKVGLWKDFIDAFDRGYA